MILRAHAKINLTLEVLGKRPDGYHEIRSVMRSLDLHDTIVIEAGGSLEVQCDITELGGEANLAYRAARLLQQETGSQPGARISIRKAVPVAAGLGGGSSDAAATLLGLDRLWRINLGDRRLGELAAQLGSDVPFFLLGSTAIAAGRGERIQRIEDQPNCHVVLVNPGFAVSTAAVYGGVTPELYSDGEYSNQFAALAPGTSPSAWPLVNVLQDVTCRIHPVIDQMLTALREWGAVQSRMCGSGPTCFGLFSDSDRADAAVQAASARGWRAWLTRFA
ncbi:MAG: 4-diphosphocytidyl-2-C-methyl-D-erythritol kinase [Chloroflexi bacterium]|nr:4-diphosphocytidyl-2-C-methyl-D-erythritol kinase [Chloroflexota bacterium]